MKAAALQGLKFVLMPQEMQWEVHPTERALHGQEAQWWIPDADIKNVVIPENSFKAILGHLREMPEGEISRKLQEMNDARHSFFFQVCSLYPCSPFFPSLIYLHTLEFSTFIDM